MLIWSMSPSLIRQNLMKSRLAGSFIDKLSALVLILIRDELANLFDGGLLPGQVEGKPGAEMRRPLAGGLGNLQRFEPFDELDVDKVRPRQGREVELKLEIDDRRQASADDLRLIPHDQVGLSTSQQVHLPLASIQAAESSLTRTQWLIEVTSRRGVHRL